jgi:hypothetical protein
MSDSPVEQIKGLAPQAKIEMLENEVRQLRKAIEIYERERVRFRHAQPEFTGDFFISGKFGNIDNNGLPDKIEICPSYGCAWTTVYEKTEKIISYEGS